MGVHRKRRLPWWGWPLLATAVVLAGGLAAYLVYEYRLEQELSDAIAEADRLDPGWRHEDMERARATVRDAENSAPLVLAAAAKVPVNWPTQPPGVPEFLDRLAEVPPPEPLLPAELPALRAEHAQVAAALAIARDLADRPRGRYVVAWSPDLVGTVVPHLDALRRVMLILVLDAYVRGLDGDGEGALRSCRALFNTGRSVGDEPMAISQFIRARCAGQAVLALERVLAQTAVAPEALARMQRQLADEAEHAALPMALRSSRVDYFQALDLMRTGRFDRAVYRMQSSRLGAGFDARVDASRARAAQAAYLRHATALVEIAKLPTDQQEEALQQRARPQPPLPGLLEALMGDLDWVKRSRWLHRSQASVRCATAALAAERYRLAESRWPDTLDALVPRYLAAVPLDPFDGRPLRLRRLPDGLVIYSVNADRTDDAGRLNRSAPDTAGTDVGFQLWDAVRR